jgi:hypothetical protein
MRFLALAALGALTTLGAAAALVACGPPGDRPEPRTAKDKERLCPPPPEPERQAAVVGTIGPLHLVESQYPLSRLGDVLAAFKPDLVLVQARVEAFRDSRLEEASFETTYVTYLARQRGIAVEPIDWFREQDLGAAPLPVDPWDESEIARREADVLAESRLLTFDKANADDMRERTMLATFAEARHRSGDPIGSRRRAWIQSLAASAVTRHGRPKRVLAFVDVFDRPPVDMVLLELGYTARSPVDIAAKAKEVMMTDVPPDVVADWKAQLGRVEERLAKATGADKAFWGAHERALAVAVERRGACCVTEAALAPAK